MTVDRSAETALAEATRALEWYAERRNYVPAGPPMAAPPEHLMAVDAYDANGPGARARFALMRVAVLAVRSDSNRDTLGCTNALARLADEFERDAESGGAESPETLLHVAKRIRTALAAFPAPDEPPLRVANATAERIPAEATALCPHERPTMFCHECAESWPPSPAPDEPTVDELIRERAEIHGTHPTFTAPDETTGEAVTGHDILVAALNMDRTALEGALESVRAERDALARELAVSSAAPLIETREALTAALSRLTLARASMRCALENPNDRHLESWLEAEAKTALAAVSVTPDTEPT